MSKGKAIPRATNTTSDGRSIEQLNKFYCGSGYHIEETTYGVSVYSESGPFLFRRKTLDAVRTEITKRIEADAVRWDNPKSEPVGEIVKRQHAAQVWADDYFAKVDQATLSSAHKALAVIVGTNYIRSYLAEFDPMALKQCQDVLKPAPGSPPDAVASALLDVMDGVQPHEIQGMTGLPEARCAEIYGIVSGLLKGSK